MTRNEINLLIGIVVLGVVIFLYGTISTGLSSNKKKYAYYDETRKTVYTAATQKLLTFTNRKPVINVKDEMVASVNSEISNAYDTAVTREEYFDYKSHIDDGIISLVIISGDNTYLGNTYKVYNLKKFEDGKYYLISNKTLSSSDFYNISISEFENVIINQLKQYYIMYKNRANFLSETPMEYSQFMETMLTNPINFDNISLYLCEDAKMCVYYEPNIDYNIRKYLSVKIDYKNYRLKS